MKPDRTRSAPSLFVASILGALALHAPASAQVLHFVQSTDTIQVPLHTSLSTQATFEARIRIPLAGTPDGTIYHEERSGLQDKALGCYDHTAYGWAWTRNYDNLPTTAESPPMLDGLWHHVAFVRDDTEERFYLDGTLVYTVPWTEQIGNWATGTPMTLGASRFFYATDAPLIWVDWLRISRTARYAGANSPPPECEPASDANTLALFLFNDAPGSLTAHDSGPRAAHGTLGFGFAVATSPVFETDPGQNGGPSFTQPLSVAGTLAGSASFSVGAIGPGAFAYSWRKDTVAIDVLANSSAATSTLLLTNLQPADVASYDCVVTNACGSVLSNPAMLSLCAADFDGDGTVDFFDYDAFVICFEGGPCPPGKTADFDGDGSADFFDYDAFVQAFELGC